MKNAKYITNTTNTDGRNFVGYFKMSDFKLSQLSNENHKGFWLDRRILIVINIIRYYYGKPIKINSCARTPAYNAQTPGSADLSYHRVLPDRPVAAIDIDVVNGGAAELKKLREVIVKNISVLKAYGLKGVGFYSDHRSFIHIDSGGDHFHTWSFGGAMTGAQEQFMENAKPATGAQLAAFIYSAGGHFLL